MARARQRSSPAWVSAWRGTTASAWRTHRLARLRYALAYDLCLSVPSMSHFVAEEAMQRWKALSQLEMDFGPKKSKRGSPSWDRTLHKPLELPDSALEGLEAELSVPCGKLLRLLRRVALFSSLFWYRILANLCGNLPHLGEPSCAFNGTGCCRHASLRLEDRPQPQAVSTHSTGSFPGSSRRVSTLRVYSLRGAGNAPCLPSPILFRLPAMAVGLADLRLKEHMRTRRTKAKADTVPRMASLLIPLETIPQAGIQEMSLTSSPAVAGATSAT